MKRKEKRKKKRIMDSYIISKIISSQMMKKSNHQIQGWAQLPKPLNAIRKTQKSQKKFLRKTENATQRTKINEINAKRKTENAILKKIFLFEN